MRILKKISVLMMACIFAFTLFGCGSSKIDYSKYDGFIYTEPGSSLVKYSLDTKDGLALHCFFDEGDGSGSTYESVYTMDMDSAETDGDTLTIKKVTDNTGFDISSFFKKLTFKFEEDKVIMDVERDEQTLAGGSGNNLLTGSYLFQVGNQVEK